jgi:hypothetical protein
MEKLESIFVDFQNGDKEGRIRLNTVGTFRDIKEKNIHLRNGLELLLDDRDGLSTPGIVEFSKEENIWVAKIDWNLFK